MATIDLDVLTNGTTQNNEWSGTGIFDVLTNAVNKNIEIQYNKGRIKGADYANVYLSSMQAVIAQSVQFLQQKQLTEAQIDQINAQRVNTEIEKAANLYEKDVILPEKAKLLHVDRVLKDKQAAALGQDRVLKPENIVDVYQPHYVLATPDSTAAPYNV